MNDIKLNFQMRLGVFLALVASSLAIDCNVGNLVLKGGVITAKSLRKQPCAGMCSRAVLSTEESDFVMLSCQENEVDAYLFCLFLLPIDWY